MSKLRMLQIYRHVADSELTLEHFQCEHAEKTQFTSKMGTTIEGTYMQEIFLLFIINSGMFKLRMLEIYRHVADSELALQHFQREHAEKLNLRQKWVLQLRERTCRKSFCYVFFILICIK